MSHQQTETTQNLSKDTERKGGWGWWGWGWGGVEKEREKRLVEQKLSAEKMCREMDKNNDSVEHYKLIKL